MCFALLLGSCTKKMTNEGDALYNRKGVECAADRTNHWLLDIEARSASDSLFINTNRGKQKLELHRLQLDSTSSIYKILRATCQGDSVDIELKAIDFYVPLGGAVPSFLKQDEIIFMKVWMRDKLGDMEHVSFKKLFENQSMQAYMEQFGWNATKDAETLIFFERLKTNNGQRGSFDKAKISYTIKLLNDNVLARSQEGDPFVYDRKDQGILGGIHYILKNLAVGESGRCVVPSDEAFGPDGNSKVPGYTPIVIEVEVLEKVD
jgi:hypothetical protein